MLIENIINNKQQLYELSQLLRHLIGYQENNQILFQQVENLLEAQKKAFVLEIAQSRSTLSKEESQKDYKALKYFTTDYEVIIKPGPKRKGVIEINNEIIKISSVESDLCVTLVNQLKDDWKYINERDLLDVGWVTYEEFILSVAKWTILEKERKEEKLEDENIEDKIIINAISRLNLKIRNKLKLRKTDNDLIENGRKYSRERRYRFHVYPKLITIE